jgi:pyruvate formate lyase activating enzyme
MQSGGGSKTIWIRTPVIPGATDSEDNIDGIGRLIASELNGRVERWDLLMFNHLCRDKYLRLDLDWDFARTELVSRVKAERLAEVACNSGVDPDIVHWSGSTRIETADNPISEER